MEDDILIVIDKNIITGLDDNSLSLCISNIAKKV